MRPLQIILVVYGIIGFVFLWFLIGHCVAYMSGWKRLARQFHTPNSFSGTQIRLWHVRMNISTYDNVIYLGADPNGLHLRMNVLFSIGHSPLFIPWGEITIGPELRYLFFIRITKLELGREAKIPFRIWGRKAQELLAPNGVRPMTFS